MRRIIVVLIVLLASLIKNASSEDKLSFGFTEPNYMISSLSSSQNHEPFSTAANSQLKFRLGFFYRLLALKEDRSGLYVSYTQNSFWKKADPGSPYLDNNFRPELYACFDILNWIERSEEPYLPKFKIALSRESNWVGGINNRSWDRLMGGWEIGQIGKTEYYGSFGLWKSFNLSSNNKDIRKYAGDAQITVGYWHFDNSCTVKWGGSMNMRFRMNNPDITSIVTSVFYNPLVGKNLKIIPALMVEYYYGYAECLMNYKAKTNSIRFGVAFM